VKKIGIASFAGKNKDFKLYLLAMRTWLEYDKQQALKEAASQ
jgi:hypothetical protein